MGLHPAATAIVLDKHPLGLPPKASPLQCQQEFHVLKAYLALVEYHEVGKNESSPILKRHRFPLSLLFTFSNFFFFLNKRFSKVVCLWSTSRVLEWLLLTILSSFITAFLGEELVSSSIFHSRNSTHICKFKFSGTLIEKGKKKQINFHSAFNLTI